MDGFVSYTDQVRTHESDLQRENDQQDYHYLVVPTNTVVLVGNFQNFVGPVLKKERNVNRNHIVLNKDDYYSHGHSAGNLEHSIDLLNFRYN